MNIQKKKELSHKINFMKQSFFNFTKTVENLNKIYQNTCGVLFYLSYLYNTSKLGFCLSFFINKKRDHLKLMKQPL